MKSLKFATLLFLISTQLSACSTGVFSLSQPTLQAIAPDVPAIPKSVQKQAAGEMREQKCPAENIIINECLVTRDEARLIGK